MAHCPADCSKPLCPVKQGACGGGGGLIGNKPIVWVLGGPGSGKGTQCEKIKAKYGFTHFSTGDLLREEIERGSEQGKKIKEMIGRGELVTNEIVLGLLKDAMLRKAQQSKGFLIDGYPRELRQGAEFEKSVGPVTTILYFEATDQTLAERCLERGKTSGRIDDTEEAIQKRLKIFHEKNVPVLTQYPQKVVKIDAERHKDEIFKDVVEVLDPIMAKQLAVTT